MHYGIRTTFIFLIYDFIQKIKDGVVTYYGHKLKYIPDNK